MIKQSEATMLENQKSTTIRNKDTPTRRVARLIGHLLLVGSESFACGIDFVAYAVNICAKGAWREVAAVDESWVELHGRRIDLESAMLLCARRQKDPLSQDSSPMLDPVLHKSNEYRFPPITTHR
jgi:hypothetical protein